MVREVYTASQIEVLEGLEPVRRRPGMYIGSTHDLSGLHHLIREIVDNSVDEVMNGYGNKIIVKLNDDFNGVTIRDYGRGIPCDPHPVYKCSALQLILTTLHAGGKFSARNYEASGGLHGVGASVVNALSSVFRATVWRGGSVFSQRYQQGTPGSDLSIEPFKSRETGTEIYFEPDPEIFTYTTFEPKLVKEILKEKAYLNPGLQMIFEHRDERIEYHYPEGIKGFLAEQVVNDSIIGDKVFYIHEKNEQKFSVSVAFGWNESDSERYYSFVNGIKTRDGGTHEDALKQSIVKVLKSFMQTHNLAKGKLIGEDYRSGIIAVLSVIVPSSVGAVQFLGQTKDKLTTVEVKTPIEDAMRIFEKELTLNPSYAAVLANHICENGRKRVASASVRTERKGVLKRVNLPGKLADCSSSKAKDCELFIVEGDSAGGSAKQGRDRNIQAVLPLRGKIINSIASVDSKIVLNREIQDLISAIGTGSGKDLEIDKCRYHKVIILTDADADGMHIGSLLLGFFFKYMPKLIEAGYLYLGLPPLYKVASGKTERWVYTERERDKLIASFKKEVRVTRFKGLGEMNPKSLWETTLNPATRTLLRVTCEDKMQVDNALERLMGKDSSKRAEMIFTAGDVGELDI